MFAGASAIALTLLSSAASAKQPQPPAEQLADRLDIAFRTCALQLTKRDHLSEKNREELGKVGVELASPPPDVLAMAQRLYGANGIYASVVAPQGKIWVAASATVSACKVTFGDTEQALGGRVDWLQRLKSSTAWRYDKARSWGNGQLQRDFFVLNPDRPGGHMILFIDGPYTVVNEGKGIQMIMTVALDPAKAK